MQVSATLCALMAAAIGILPGFRVLSRSRPSTPVSAKRLLPSPHGRPADADALHHPLRRVPIRRGEHDARPLDVLARGIAVGDYRRQLLALRGAQHHTYPLCHGPASPLNHSLHYGTF